MRTALNSLRDIIATDETLVREDARAAANDSVDRLEQLWTHLQRNHRWSYHHSWPAMCERALLEHLAVVADWADQLPQPIPLYARDTLRDLLQVSELVSFHYTGKIKTGEEKIYGLEIWNTRPVSFATAPGLKGKADGLFANVDGDYGWHIQPVDKKGRKVGYIFLFDSTLSEEELIWEPLHFTPEDLEDLVAEAAFDDDQKDKKEKKNKKDRDGHDPLRDTMKDKRGRKLLNAVHEAVNGAPQTDAEFAAWSGSFKAPSAAGHLAYSAKDFSLNSPMHVTNVADHLASLEVTEEEIEEAIVELGEGSVKESTDDRDSKDKEKAKKKDKKKAEKKAKKKAKGDNKDKKQKTK